MTHVDQIFVGGHLVTMDPAKPEAEAVAVTGGKIVYVGDEKSARDLAGPKTEIVDLKGATMLPGFIEAHGHPMMSGLVWGEPVIDIRAIHSPTYEAAMAKIKRRVAKAAPGEFLMATGLDPTMHEGMREPSRDELDEIAPNNPLIVVLFNFHGVYLNSAAVKVCGYENGVEGHFDSEIIRDAKGRPWKFREEMAKRTRNVFFAACGKERSVRELRDWTNKFASAGYTTTAEIGMHPQWVEYFDAVRKDSELPVRMRIYEQILVDTPFVKKVGEGDDRFKAIGSKLWADGSIFVGNVAMTRPYLTTEMTVNRMGMPPDNPGNLNYPKELLSKLMEKGITYGWQLAVHTQGDATIDATLDAYEDLISRYGVKNGPYRLEHCTMMRPDQVERAHKLGLVCSFFNTIAYFWGDAMRNDMFGSDRGDAVLPFGTAIRAGMRATFHCDAPMTWPNALLCIQFAVNRKTHKGTVLGEHERITVDQALRAVTIDAAHHLQMEDIAGSIVEGKYADFVVLSADPRKTDPDQISAIKVLQTYVAGVRKHDAEKAAASA